MAAFNIAALVILFKLILGSIEMLLLRRSA